MTSPESNPIEHWFDQCAKDRREVEVTILARELFIRWMQNWDGDKDIYRGSTSDTANEKAERAFFAAERFYSVLDERRGPKS